MAEKPLEQLTVREMCNELERRLSELEEHLDRGFQPKVKNLRRLVRPQEPNAEPIRDITIRQSTEEVLKSEFFTNELYEKIVNYLTAIDQSLTETFQDP